MTDLLPELVSYIVSRNMDPVRSDIERTFMLLGYPPAKAKAVAAIAETALNAALLGILEATGTLEDEHGGGATASAVDLVVQMLEIMLPQLRASNRAAAEEGLGPTASMWTRPI